MFRFLRKHRTLVLIFVGVVFVGLLVFGIGSPSFQASPHDTIATVNNEKVTLQEFDLLYNQILRVRSEITEEQRRALPQEVFHELIRQKVFNQEARRYGIHVTDQEVQLFLASMPAFQKEGQFDPRTYYETVVRVFGMTPHRFEELRKVDIADRKLRYMIASSIHIPDPVLEENLQEKMAKEKDATVRKKLKDTPELHFNELRNEEINLVFADWLTQLNSKLKVAIVSEQFKKRLAGES